ncbi:MAG: type VII secretion integral membrane protein EccD [Mycobacterium sp.]
MSESATGLGSTPVLPIVRVAILAESRLTEVALPSELPLREILPAVRRLLPADDTAGEPPRLLSLAPVGGAPFSLDATLDTVGVVDGDLLALQPVPTGPAAPGIVEDIADATVIFSASRLKPWGIRHIQAAARAAMVVLVLVVTGIGVSQVIATNDPVGLYVVSVLAAVTAVAALLLRARVRPPVIETTVVALVPITAAFTLAVPGDFGAAQVLLGAAGATAWSLISVILAGDNADRSRAFFTAGSVVGLGVALAAGVALIWSPPLLSLGCLLVVLALLITVQAAQLSALWARLPLPVIPAPGDPAPSGPSLSVLRDLPRRVRISEAHQTGFIAGAVVLSVLGCLAIAGLAEAPGGWGWYVVVATGAAAVLRARVWDTVSCKAWLLAQPHLVAVILVVSYLVQGRHVAALWAGVVLAAMVAVWVLAATNPKLASAESYSLPMRRLVGFVASGVDASLIPVMAYLVGVFTWILNR